MIKPYVLGLGVSLLTPLFIHAKTAQAEAQAKISVQIPTCAVDANAKTKASQNIYDVFRNGDVIGSHTITFNQTGEQLVVDIETELKVKLAFVVVYKNYYHSVETWCDDKIQSVMVESNANGDKSRSTINRSDDNFILTAEFKNEVPAAATAPLSLMPSSHWNKAVLASPELMHTIQGYVYPIDVKARSTENHKTFQGQGYDVSGDYDYTTYYKDRHWQGMAFYRGKKNFIEFRCVVCEATPDLSPRKSSTDLSAFYP